MTNPIPEPKRHSSFVIRISDLIRHSNFGFRISRAFRRARPGSVLIIVIVLLLLLAIIGAAYISTTRSSRVASAQNVLNSDVDGMLTGISKICEGVIVDDLNDPFGNLNGNTAYIINPPPANPVVNRSFYQGEAGKAPPVTPNVPTDTAGTNYLYNPGDIVNDASNQNIFFAAPQTNPVAATPLSTTLATPIPPSNAPNTGWQIMTGHLPITAAGSDPWLAARIPTLDTANNPIWQFLTQSIQVNTTYPAGAPASLIGTDFEDPTYDSAAPGFTIGGISFLRNPAATNNIITASLNPLLVSGNTPATALHPTYFTLPNGTNIPALTYNYGSSAKTFAAGDADGDGIADSLLFRIPGTSYDGLTWYAAVRIIDNNSAINANTAWSRDSDYIYTAGTPTAINNYWSLFQTSVGLQELVNIGDTSTGAAVVPPAPPNYLLLNKYRFNSATPTAGQAPYDETAIYSNPPPTAFSRSTPGTGDYNFLSESEAYYQQLIRRIANPGINTGTTRYQPFPLADQGSLASHFCLTNSSSSTPQSALETFLPDSLFWKTPPTPTTAGVAYSSNPYDPANTSTWFTDNFAYPFPITPPAPDNLTQPLRALLVTHNPVSNRIQQIYNNNDGSTNVNTPNIYAQIPPALATQPSIADPILPAYMLPYSGANSQHYKGVWNSGVTYGLNDIVVYPGPAFTAGVGTYSGPSNTYISVVAINTANQPASPLLPAAGTPNNVITSVNTAFWQLQPWTANPVKANVNTATFRELFRAFWCVMAGNPSNATPFGYTPVDTFGIYDNKQSNPQHEFRSPLRDPTTTQPSLASQLDSPGPSGGTATNTNTMLLRAAIAAVNTLGLRDNSENIISKTIVLNNAFVANTMGGTPSLQQVEARVFSNAPQPFITEIYADNYNGVGPTGSSNPNGYIAVELFNPYPVAIPLVNWQLGYINRGGTALSGGTYPNLTVNSIAPAISTDANGNPASIPANGYVLLENYSATRPSTQPSDATYRSVGSGLPPTGTLNGSATQPSTQPSANMTDIYVPGLAIVTGGTSASTQPSPTTQPTAELVLLRPRRSDGTYTAYYDPVNDPGKTEVPGSESFNEGTPAAPNLYDLVPVDSYDFTGFPTPPPDPNTGTWTAWSYLRGKGTGHLFEATFPGNYDSSKLPHNDFTSAIQGRPTGSPMPMTLAWDTQAIPAFGAPANSSYVYYEAGRTTNNMPVQVYNVSAINTSSTTPTDPMHFPNSVVTPSYNPVENMSNPTSQPSTPGITPTSGTPTKFPPFLFPHGGFARNGDMLDIPFIGAYRIRQVVPPGGASTGSFLELNSLPMDCEAASIDDQLPASTMTPAENIGRFVPMAASSYYVGKLAGGATNLPDYYSWTRNLFNYLTVQSSTDTYMPNFDPNVSSSNYTGTPTFAYPPQNASASNPNPIPPTPTLTADATAYDQTKQDSVGVEGLVNINTAPWKVLSMLPFVPSTTANAAAIDQQIAQNIVNYRLTYGPFTSIFDLNLVPGFQTGTSVSWAPPAALPAPAAFAAPTSQTGLLSPADPNFGTAAASTTATGVPEDYQWDCLTLTRISNLITTRSDTFTVYIEVQGWQNVGSTLASQPPQPVTTRRYAFIVDRTAIGADPSSRFLKTLVVPND